MNAKSRVVMVILFVMAISALAWSVEAGQATVTKTSTSAERAAVAAFWTRDRIAHAPALALKVDRGPGGVDAAALAEIAGIHIGPAGSVAPGLADPDADGVAQFTYYQDWATGYAQQPTIAEDLPADDPAGTRNVFTYFDINTQSAFWQIYPHKWMGKLTFTTPTGGASCSATAISNNHIVTAAHCVYDSSINRWYTNWAFTPAFRNGSTPYGTFPWRTATVLSAWINLAGSYTINTWTRYDVAIIEVGPNSAARTLNSMVGWAGRMWNASYTQLVFNGGYPAQTYTGAALSYPAQYLRACIAETFTQTTETLGSGCYYGRGISGGPWLLSYKPFVLSGYVNSVNSGLYIGQPNLYGARFNSSNIVPLCTSQGC